MSDGAVRCWSKAGEGTELMTQGGGSGEEGGYEGRTRGVSGWAEGSGRGLYRTSSVGSSLGAGPVPLFGCTKATLLRTS